MKILLVFYNTQILAYWRTFISLIVAIDLKVDICEKIVDSSQDNLTSVQGFLV